MRRALMLAAMSLAVIVPAGCGGRTAAPPAAPPSQSTAASPTPSTEPRTAEAAQAAAQREFDLYAAGDWAGAWDLWTAAGKAAMPRGDYVRLQTECKTLTGITFEIVSVRLDGDTAAVVAWKRSIAAGTARMTYENGGWRFQPDPLAMAGYAKGITKLLAEKKKAGDCG